MRELGEPDAVARGRRGQRVRAVAVDEAVLVEGAAEDGEGGGRRGRAETAGAGVVAGQGFGVAEFRRQVVEVVVEPDVPGCGVGIHAAEGVEGREQARGAWGAEVREPRRVRAGDAVAGVEGVGGGTRVLWFEAVDVRGLHADGEGRGVEGRVHSHRDLGGDLRCDDVVRNAEGEAGGVVCGREKGQEVVVDAEEVCAVLAAVEEAAGGDLRELAGAVWEAGGVERVEGGLGDVPCNLGGGVVGRSAVVVERFVVAEPGVLFQGEGVGGVGGAFVMAVNDFDVLEREVGVWRDVLGGPGVGHVAIVVG